MDSYYDHEDQERMTAKGTVRFLPYATKGEVAHYDFIKDPALIPEVLEDFKPYGDQPGVKKFYRLLRYLNGPRSPFETTDCLFRGPISNATPHNGNGASLQLHGRLMLVYRDHADNLNEGATDALCNAFRTELADIRPGWPMGCIGTAFYWAYFSSLSPIPCEEATGREFVMRFWAWGNEESECFQNFGTLMQGVGVALCRVGSAYRQWVALGRPEHG